MECGSQIHQLLNVVAIVVDHFSPVYKRTETQSWHNPVESYVDCLSMKLKKRLKTATIYASWTLLLQQELLMLKIINKKG